MRNDQMSKSLRLSDTEQEAIRQKAIEINRLLVKQGRQPVRDSELAHKIIELSIGYVALTPNGEIVLERD